MNEVLELRFGNRLKRFDTYHNDLSLHLEMGFRNCFVDGVENLVALCFRFEDMLAVVCGMGKERGFERLGREIPQRIEDASDTHYLDSGACLHVLTHKCVMGFREYGK